MQYKWFMCSTALINKYPYLGYVLILFSLVWRWQKSLEASDAQGQSVFGANTAGSSLSPLLGQPFLVQLPGALDTLQATERFPYVSQFPKQCLVTQGIFWLRQSTKKCFFIKMSSRDSFLLGAFSGTWTLLWQQQYKCRVQMAPVL